MTTKTELEKMIEPLGENPTEELARLQRESRELALLKSILPEIIREGALSQLHQHPADADALPVLSWQAVSNVELAEDTSEASAYERLRRSFLGIQQYNASVAPMDVLYPNEKALSELANTESVITRRWLQSPYIRDEIARYSEPLRPGCVTFDEKIAHNRKVLTGVTGRLKALVKWPDAYGPSAW